MLDVSLRAMSDFKSAWLLPIYGMLLMSGLAFLWSVSVDSRGQRGGQSGWPALRGFFVHWRVISELSER